MEEEKNRRFLLLTVPLTFVLVWACFVMDFISLSFHQGRGFLLAGGGGPTVWNQTEKMSCRQFYMLMSDQQLNIFDSWGLDLLKICVGKKRV